MRGTAFVILFCFLQCVAANFFNFNEIENLNALKNQNPTLVRTSDEIHTNKWGQKFEEITTIAQYNRTNHHAKPKSLTVITIEIDEYGNELISEKEIHVIDTNEVAKAKTSSSTPSSTSSVATIVGSGSFGSATNAAAASGAPSPHVKPDSSSAASGAAASSTFGPTSYAQDSSRSSTSAPAASSAASGTNGGRYGPNPHKQDSSVAAAATAATSGASMITIEVDEFGNELISERVIQVMDTNKIAKVENSSSSALSSSAANAVDSGDFEPATSAATIGYIPSGGHRSNPYKQADYSSAASRPAISDTSGGKFGPSSYGQDSSGSSVSAAAAASAAGGTNIGRYGLSSYKSAAIAATGGATVINIGVDQLGNEFISEQKIQVTDTNKVARAETSSSSSSPTATTVGSGKFGSATSTSAPSGINGGKFRPLSYGKDSSGSSESSETASSSAASAVGGTNGGRYGPSTYNKDSSASAANAAAMATAATGGATMITIGVDEFGNELISEQKIQVMDTSKVAKGETSSSSASSSLSTTTTVGFGEFGSTTSASAPSGTSSGEIRPSPYGKDSSGSSESAKTAASTAGGTNVGKYGPSPYEQDSFASTANAATAITAVTGGATMITIGVDEFGNELIAEQKIEVVDTNKVAKAETSSSSYSSAATTEGSGEFGSATSALTPSGTSGSKVRPSSYGKDSSGSFASTAAMASAAGGTNGGRYGSTPYRQDNSGSAANAVTAATAATGGATMITIGVDKFGNELVSEKIIHVMDANKVVKAQTSSSSASSSLSIATTVGAGDFGTVTSATATGVGLGGGYQPISYGQANSKSATGIAVESSTSGGGFALSPNGRYSSGLAASATAAANAAAGGAIGGKYGPSPYGRDGSLSSTNKAAAASAAGGGRHGTSPYGKDGSGSTTSLTAVSGISGGGYGPNLNRQDSFGSTISAAAAALAAGGANGGTYGLSPYGKYDSGSAKSAAAATAAHVITAGGYGSSPYPQYGSGSSASATTVVAGGAGGSTYERSAYGKGGNGSAARATAAVAAAAGGSTGGRYERNPYKPVTVYGPLDKYEPQKLEGSKPAESTSQYQPGAVSGVSLTSSETSATLTKNKQRTEIIMHKGGGNDSLITTTTSASSSTSDNGDGGSSSTTAIATAVSGVQSAGGLSGTYNVPASKNCRLSRKQLYVKIGTLRQPCFTC